MSAGQSSLEQMLGVYKWVVDDVVKNCREEFLNEGVDVQVLEDLKQLWENKLVVSGALNRPKKTNVDPPQPKQKQQQQRQQQQHASGASPPLPPPPPLPSAVPTSITSVIQQAPPKTQTTATAPVETRPSTAPSSLPPPPLIDTTQLSLLQPQLHQVAALAQNVSGSAAASTSVATPSASSVYSLAGAMAAGVQPIMVSNPAAAGLLLQQRGLGMTTYMMPYLPLVQQQALAALAQQQQRLQQQQQQQQNNPNDAASSKDLEQSDGPPAIVSSLPPAVERMQLACEGPCKVKDKHAILRRRRRRRRQEIISCQLRSCAGSRGHESILQLDGPVGGSSSEESDDGSDDTDEDEEQQDPYDGYEDDDPLNSADDADSDEDDQALETDNTIVCQFEKVYRVRTKWKFALKDGIMNLKGYDYIFTKTTGEADW